MIYLKDESSMQERERERNQVAIYIPLPLSSPPACAGMEPAGSEWNDRAAWSMLALKGIEEKLLPAKRTAADRHDISYYFPIKLIP